MVADSVPCPSAFAAVGHSFSLGVGTHYHFLDEMDSPRPVTEGREVTNSLRCSYSIALRIMPQSSLPLDSSSHDGFDKAALHEKEHCNHR